MERLSSVAVGLLALCLIAAVSPAADWPGFLGPAGTGVGDKVDLPAQWTAENILWKVKLPGPGTATPIISGDKLFITCYSCYGPTYNKPLNIANPLALDKAAAGKEQKDAKGAGFDPAELQKLMEQFGKGGKFDPAAARKLMEKFSKGGKFDAGALGQLMELFGKGGVGDAAEQKNLRLFVLCFNGRTGKHLWQREVEPKLPEASASGFVSEHGFASSTPVTDGERLFVFFGKTGVLAFDFEGNKLWQADVGSLVHPNGTASSLLLYKDSVIVNAGVESNSLLALDKATGKELWRIKDITANWTSPVVVRTTDNKDEVVLALSTKVSGFDPLTGKELWHVLGSADDPLLAAFGNYSTTFSTPVAKDGIVYISLASFGGENTVHREVPMKPASFFPLFGMLVMAVAIGAISEVGAQDKAAPKPAGEQIKPFKIAVDDAVLRDLKDRLARTRWPDQIAGTNLEHGVPVAYMKELVNYWHTKYDWRQQEKYLNKFDQFVTKIDGLDIHFVHVRSKEKNALPLMLIHGWPGSFVEFHKIIGPLTDPVAHGGKAEDAFHVICPSLPGFAFSSKPQERGWNIARISEVMAKLMARLGYDRYGAQGGDIGSIIAPWLATNDGNHCVGAHSNCPNAKQPATDPNRGVTAKELDRYQQRKKDMTDQMSYVNIQGTRPLTLSYGLNDSPAGLASWIVDKFYAWSDHGGKLENIYTKDELLNNVMLYWVTESMPSATRLYFEQQHNAPRPKSMTPFKNSDKKVPLGFAAFPKEIVVPPKAWVERVNGTRMIHWTEMPRGGHFAALEQPVLLGDDVRVFFRKVR